MQVITLLGKMLESYSSFDIQQNVDCTIYTCYSGNYIVNEIESIVDVAGRGGNTPSSLKPMRIGSWKR